MHRSKWIFIILLGFYPCLGIAKSYNDHTDCYFLGSAPSLIIKFRNFSSSQFDFTKHINPKLQASKATFPMARPMSGDAFIVFFQSNELTAQIKPGCYSRVYIENLIEELKINNDVEHGEPNILMRISKDKFAPPVISTKQWNLLNPPGGIDAPHAFNITLGNPKAIIAVLDSGILPNNSLTPNLLGGVTFNDNGSFKVGAAPACNASCQGYDHGTHVAGIAAASGRLAYGESIFGVAPNAKLLPINVFTKLTNPIDCEGEPAPCIRSSTADQINALNWLNGYTFSGLPVAPYVTLINMSLGENSLCGTLLQQAFNQLFNKNISTAVAAGNDNKDAIFESPANCKGVMVVAATDEFGFGASYSNFGKTVSFAAPGGDAPFGLGIYSTLENRYGYSQGTSMASPHVAGLGALLYSLDPTLTPATLLTILRNTTTPFPPGGPGFSCIPAKPCGTGIINAYRAVLATLNQAPRLVWNSNLNIHIDSRTQITVQWQPAVWQPARNTKIVYTVNLNGVDVPDCTNLFHTHCLINNVNPKIVNKIFISATDIREIYNPVTTSIVKFTTFVFTGPVLNVAERNPLKTTQAFIYYSSLGNAPADAFFVNGLSNTTLAIDTAKNRFIIDGITIPKKIDNISIAAQYGDFLAKSNSISIPSIL